MELDCAMWAIRQTNGRRRYMGANLYTRTTAGVRLLPTREMVFTQCSRMFYIASRAAIPALPSRYGFSALSFAIQP
jgi:hypothetical protein